MALRAPEPLSPQHNLSDFACGVASLDDWLVRRAVGNQASGASRTFVLCDGDAVAGYYALASGSVASREAPGRFRRNMPDPVPVIVLGRLAIDQRQTGRGLGRALLRDAALRVVTAAAQIGVRGLLVHAVNAEAKAFYLKFGFTQSPSSDLTLMTPLSELMAVL